MALPTAAPERQLKHRRSIDVQIYARGNGLWEVDAHITDTRTAEIRMATGLLPAGAQTAAMPYPGECNSYGDAYARLVGLNLMRGFRQAVKERLGGTQGCTHITELALVLPTAVVQAFAGDVIDTRGDAANSEQPFQIDRCHALRAEGLAVKTYYPRWYRAAPATSRN